MKIDKEDLIHAIGQEILWLVEKLEKHEDQTRDAHLTVTIASNTHNVLIRVSLEKKE